LGELPESLIFIGRWEKKVRSKNNVIESKMTKKLIRRRNEPMQILVMTIALLAFAQAITAAQPPTQLNVLQMQVMLDRAGFSPGEIDGRMGVKTQRARAMFKKYGNQEQPVEPVTLYRITPEDAAGPFVTIPKGMMQQASLSALGYTSLLEAIAERFHCSPTLLRHLNPDALFTEGEEIKVPNVEAMVLPMAPSKTHLKKPSEQLAPEATVDRKAVPAKPKVVVTVTKSLSALTVTDASGRVLFYAPVTSGSRHDPLPIGKWKVNGAKFNPNFHYNPHLFWNADPRDAKATVPPGPNNPVGLVWIDISKAHYGLHGTPEPSMIGRTHSHGCVRLTNWDALKLAGMVKPGTRVIFKK